MNNSQKINQTFYLTIEDIEIDGKKILYVYIPESSQVHRCNGKIFDRNEDGDFEITNNTNLVAAMYMRKQSKYTENRIYPFAKISDKHLNDKFYLEKDQRISLRDKIFREVVSNILIHREFSNPYPVKLIIEKDRVITENSNKPHGIGIIDPENFSPYPKNPKIARFFKEIGWVDELGSGVKNIYKYNKIYSGAEPTFIEGDVFKTIIPLNKKLSDQESDQASDQVEIDKINEESITNKILEFCKTPRSRAEI